MERFNLATRLNNKVACIVAICMLAIIAFSLWMSYQEKKKECLAQLEVVTAFLVAKMPDETFVKITVRQGAAGKPMEEQVMAVNKEIQPILANVLVPSDEIKYGVYSRYHGRNIAIGPEFDASLLVFINPGLFGNLYETNTAQFGESKKSIVWYGAPTIYHMSPIERNGEIIGHTFASVNLTKVYAGFWKKTINVIWGAVIALLVVIMFFQDAFIRLNKDLVLFAESITKGQAKQFESKIPELTPVLQHISEQAEKMARLDRLNVIGEMAASIGHEVRNPMTTVRGFLQRMENKEEFKDSKGHFKLMIEELDRANSIITEFLSLAKNKSMNFVGMDLNKVILELTPLMQADTIRHNCQLELCFGNIPVVRADENSIRQLILNLVRNAIEALPRGGNIKIRTAKFEGKVLLVVADQGVGMSPEVLDKLGTPFFTTKENGVGIGLAVCYRIAQRHGATISVESEPGEGTIFTIGFNIDERRINC